MGETNWLVGFRFRDCHMYTRFRRFVENAHSVGREEQGPIVVFEGAKEYYLLIIYSWNICTKWVPILPRCQIYVSVRTRTV